MATHVEAPKTGPFLGWGIYDIAEAARLVGRHPETVARWTRGANPLHHMENDRIICFLNLLSLWAMSELIRRGVPRREIREGGQYVAKHVGTDYPFALQGLATVGAGFFGKFKEWVDVGKGWSEILPSGDRGPSEPDRVGTPPTADPGTSRRGPRRPPRSPRRPASRAGRRRRGPRRLLRSRPGRSRPHLRPTTVSRRERWARSPAQSTRGPAGPTARPQGSRTPQAPDGLRGAARCDVAATSCPTLAAGQERVERQVDCLTDRRSLGHPVDEQRLVGSRRGQRRPNSWQTIRIRQMWSSASPSLGTWSASALAIIKVILRRSQTPDRIGNPPLPTVGA